MEEVKFDHESTEKIFEIFKDFMARVAKLEELGTLGGRFLSNIQQGFELLRRPEIDRKSKLIGNIVETNTTPNMRSYFEAGCINTHDVVQSANNLHTCRLGLDDHLKKARSLVDELEFLLEDVNIALETGIGSRTLTVLDEYVEGNEKATNLDKKTDINEYALLMGMIKVMVKKDYIMQEKIIFGLKLKSSPGELHSYCLMWSLHPYVDDKIIHRAWKLIA